MLSIDAVVIGSGINGMLTALEFSKIFPDLEVVIFEKEKYSGEHSTSRNSGVLHAGIYYPYNSLKREMCIKGNKIWDDLATEKDIKINRCGKYVVACGDEELPILSKFYKRAEENGVEEIRWVEGEELDNLKELVDVKKSFFSSKTGSIDLSDTIKKFENELYNKNIPLMKDSEVLNIKVVDGQFIGETKNEVLKTKILINSAGLYSVKIRRMLGLFDLEDYWVKGFYLKYSKKMKCTSLIYPVPLKNLKGLGVHTSFDSDGTVRFGPNAFDTNQIYYGHEDQDFETMYQAICRVFKCVQKDFLSFDYSGIRPKIKLNGELYTDFWVKGPKDHGISGYYEMCGIESPGFTASPAISKLVIEKILNEN